MSLYSPPPRLHSFQEDKPSLLVCWWITLYCCAIILARLGGRFIRSEKLFREDKIAALAIIPLLARIALVHVVFVYGTNNAQLPDDVDDEEIRRRAIGSGLVLATRMLYAATLWILKYAILEFFKRLTSKTWSRSHEIILLVIRCTLGLTFIGVLVSDLTECRAFQNYYQVLPDPGGQCRQGFVQLITMAGCNIVTDSMLVIFPVSIIVRSRMSVKRKLHLSLLFSLSLGVVGTSAYRVPNVIWQGGNQQIRSLLASVELLFATAAANTLVLGSFVRDRGLKKARFRMGSITGDSIDTSVGMQRNRRPMMRRWGSDEDLIRGLGLRADLELRNAFGADDEERQYKPAPIARLPEHMKHWQFPRRRTTVDEQSEDELLFMDAPLTPSDSNLTPRKVSFYDVGGLLGEEHMTRWRDSCGSSIDPLSPISPVSPVSPQSMLSSQSLPMPSIPAGTTGLRRGSQALLQDIGGLLDPPRSRSKSSPNNSPMATELQIIAHPRRGPAFDPQGFRTPPALMDPGGLLR